MSTPPRHRSEAEGAEGVARFAFPARWRGEIALAAVMVLALFLRLHDVERADIWVDEANTILTAKQSFSVILDMLKRDSSPPLYYLLLRGWIWVAGDGPTALRLLSILFTLVLVATVYVVGVREFSRRVGLWAAFLIAIAPAQILYSQQVRMYTLLPLLSLLSWWLLVRYLRRGEIRDFAWCLVSTAAALYTHNFALYILPVHAVLVLFSGQLFQRFQMWLLAVAILVLAYAPWIPTFLLQVENRDHYAWYLPVWKQYGLLGSAWNTLMSFSPAGAFVMYENMDSLSWYGVPTIVTTGLALWGGFLLAGRRREISLVGAVWLPVACAVPMLASFAVSSLLTPHYVPGRVDQMMFPAFALLAAVGISSVRPELLRRAIAPAFLAVAVIGKSSLYADYEEHGFAGTDRDLAEAIIAELRPGDAILCTSLTRASLEYYLGRAGVEAPILSFPRSTARHLGSQNDRRLYSDIPALMKEAGMVLDRAHQITAPDGRLFLLRTRSTVNDLLKPASLSSQFGVVQEKRLGGYVQAGTEEIVWLTVKRFRAAPAAASSDASPADGGG